ILGPCCAVMPAEGAVCAPCSGKITALADTLHAFCIETEGIEVLVHLGIDTVGLKGECFTAHKQNGDKVKKGDKVIDMDIEAVRKAGLDPAVIVVITNADSLGEIRFNVSPECLIEVERK
ncbi:MAG: PTS glucose transporter subunit IIA, partial [Abditibacteriota bacterium]|nr:PTS glucose transporter subunit IIA [Abditibacteriota bacterium]